MVRRLCWAYISVFFSKLRRSVKIFEEVVLSSITLPEILIKYFRKSAPQILMLNAVEVERPTNA